MEKTSHRRTAKTAEEQRAVGVRGKGQEKSLAKIAEEPSAGASATPDRQAAAEAPGADSHEGEAENRASSAAGQEVLAEKLLEAPVEAEKSVLQEPNLDTSAAAQEVSPAVDR